jgi:hypothetical protein
LLFPTAASMDKIKCRLEVCEEIKCPNVETMRLRF